MEIKGFPESVDDWYNWFSALLTQYRSCRPHTTIFLGGLSTAVFAAQLLGAYYLGAPSVRDLTNVLYVYGGSAIYLLSLFLHQGILHFLSNALGLLILSPQERHFSDKGFWTFVGAAAVFSLGGGYAILYLFANEEYIAFYGISGVVYALSGFALVRGIRNRKDVAEVDTVGAIFGISAVINVLMNLFRSFPHSPVEVNGGHLFGLIVGLIFGLTRNQ